MFQHLCRGLGQRKHAHRGHYILEVRKSQAHSVATTSAAVLHVGDGVCCSPSATHRTITYAPGAWISASPSRYFCAWMRQSSCTSSRSPHHL
jgi:hypothetical protein